MTSLGDKVIAACPFCGEHLIRTGVDFVAWAHPVRSVEEAKCPGVGVHILPDDDDAIAAWNRRAALDLSPPVVEEGAWRYDLDAVPRDRDFLIQYDHKEVTLGHYLDNSKTQWPYEGIRPCRSMRPERVSEKIIAWRELPSPDTAGSSDLAAASPNGEHLRPLADREKSAASPVPEPQAVAWRDETEAEHISRDIKEGRFPARSEKQQRPAIADAWERMRDDSELDAARRKLSMHELRRIIKHVVDAHVELAAAAPLSGGGKVEAEWRVIDDKVAGPVTVCRFGDADHSWLPMTAYRVSGGKWERPASRDSLPYDPTHCMPLPAALATMGGK